MKGLFNKDILNIVFDLKHRYNNKKCIEEYYKVFEKGYLNKFNWRELGKYSIYKYIYKIKRHDIYNAQRVASLPRKY